MSSTCLSIHGSYKATLQGTGNYSEALPAQARTKIRVLRTCRRNWTDPVAGSGFQIGDYPGHRDPQSIRPYAV